LLAITAAEPTTEWPQLELPQLNLGAHCRHDVLLLLLLLLLLLVACC
jgi:hypothetical protein